MSSKHTLSGDSLASTVALPGPGRHLYIADFDFLHGTPFRTSMWGQTPGNAHLSPQKSYVEEHEKIIEYDCFECAKNADEELHRIMQQEDRPFAEYRAMWHEIYARLLEERRLEKLHSYRIHKLEQHLTGPWSDPRQFASNNFKTDFFEKTKQEHYVYKH